jgi:hypothetical protein
VCARRLHLVSDEAGPRTARWIPPPFDLFAQPQRPGELCEEVPLGVAASVRFAVDERAAAAGIPCVLWTSLAIEARRAATATAQTLGLSYDSVVDQLNAAAEDPGDRRGVRTRLTDYALALRSAQPRPPTQAIGPLLARPSVTVITAWSDSARREGLALEDWALATLVDAPGDALLWEAGAAEAGQTLLEWALIQAARRRRAASSAAQPAA